MQTSGRTCRGIAKSYSIVVPAQAGIQYAAAYQFNYCCLWNTGSPPEPVIGRAFARPVGGDDGRVLRCYFDASHVRRAALKRKTAGMTPPPQNR